MQWVVTCPGCAQQMKVTETAAGKHVKCPRCSRLMAVPAALPAPAQAARVEPLPAAPAPEPTRPASPRNHTRAVAIGGGVLLAVGLGVAVFVLTRPGEPPRPPEDNREARPDEKKPQRPDEPKAEEKPDRPIDGFFGGVPVRGRPHRTVKDLGEPVAVSFSPNHKTLAVGLEGGAIRLFDAGTLRPAGEVAAPPAADPLRALTFVLGGQALAAGHESGRVALVELARKSRSDLPDTGRPPRGQVRGLVASADGKRLAVEFPQSMVVWDLEKKERLKEMGMAARDAPSEPGRVALSPDGQTLAYLVTDRLTVSLIPGPLMRGPERFVPRGSPRPRLAQFSPDGKALLLCQGVEPGDAWHVVRVWDLEAQGFRGEIDPGRFAGLPLRMALSSGGLLALATAERQVQLWDVAGAKPRGVLPLSAEPRALAFSADGKTLGVAFGKEVGLWDVDRLPAGVWRTAGRGEEVTPRASADGHAGNVVGIAYADGGRTLYTASADGLLRRWDPEQLKDQRVEPTPRRPRREETGRMLGGLLVSPTNNEIFYVSSWGSVQRRTPTFPEPGGVGPEPTQGLSATLPGALLFPDGQRIAMLTRDGKVAIGFDSHGGRVHRIEPEGGALAMALSADGEDLITAGRDGVLRLWDTHSGRESGVLPGVDNDPTGLVRPRGPMAVSPDGKRLVVLAAPDLLLVYSVPGRRLLAPLKIDMRRRPVHGLLFAADSRLLAVLSRDHTIDFYDLPTRSKRGALELHPAPDSAVDADRFAAVYSPDGKTLAVGFQKGLRLYNVADLPLGRLDETRLVADDDTPAKLPPSIGTNPRRPTKRHLTPVVKVVYSADGQTVYTASGDGTVKWWDAATLEEKGTVELPHKQHLQGLAVSPDQSRIAVTYDGSHALLYDLTTKEKTTIFPDKDRRGSDRRSHVHFSPDGRYLAVVLCSAGFGDNGFCWDVEKKQARYLNTNDGRGFQALRFTGDGRLVGTASHNRLSVWDPATGKVLYETRGDMRIAPERYWPDRDLLVVSADGKLTASFWKGMTLHRWSLATYTPLEPIEFRKDWNRDIGRMALAPDGRLLAWTGRAGLQFLDLPTGRRLGSLNLDQGTPGRFPARPTDLAFSPDGKTLAMAFERGPLLWDVDSLPLEKIEPTPPARDLGPRTERPAVAARFDPYLGIAVDPVAGAVLTTGADGVLRVYAYPTMKLRSTHRLPGVAHRVGYDAGKKRLYAVIAPRKDAPPADGRYGLSDLFVFDVGPALAGKEKDGGELTPAHKVPLQAEVARLLVRPDGSSVWVLEVTDPEKTVIKKIETTRWTVTQPREQGTDVRCMCMSPDGRWLYAAGPYTKRDNFTSREHVGMLLTIDADEEYCWRNLTHAGEPYDITASNDGQLYISAGGKKPGLYGVSGSGRYIAGWPGEPWQVGVALARDRRMLYLGNARGTSPSVTCLPLGDTPPRTRPTGSSCAVEAAPGSRGELLVSPDGLHLFCDTGRMFSLEAEPVPPK